MLLTGAHAQNLSISSLGAIYRSTPKYYSFHIFCFKYYCTFIYKKGKKQQLDWAPAVDIVEYNITGPVNDVP